MPEEAPRPIHNGPHTILFESPAPDHTCTLYIIMNVEGPGTLSPGGGFQTVSHVALTAHGDIVWAYANGVVASRARGEWWGVTCKPEWHQGGKS